MRKVLPDLVYYDDQPVFEEWADNHRVVKWFSQEVTHRADGTWSFRRWVPLQTLRLYEQDMATIPRAVNLARAQLAKRLDIKLKPQ